MTKTEASKSAAKPAMLLKWHGESAARQISRESAAATIKKNRRAAAELRIKVCRKHGETYIASDFLGVACVIYRATGSAA